MHSTSASRSLRKTFNTTGPRIKTWGTPLVTGHQPVVAPFTTTLQTLSFSQFITQRGMNLFSSQLDKLSRRMLWGTIPRAWLKSSRLHPNMYKSATCIKNIKSHMILPLPSPKYFCIFHILSPNCSFAKMTPGRHNTHKASLSSFSLISSYALCNDHTIFTRVQVCTCYICSASICSVDMHSFIKHRKDKDGRTRSH